MDDEFYDEKFFDEYSGKFYCKCSIHCSKYFIDIYTCSQCEDIECLAHPRHDDEMHDLLY